MNLITEPWIPVIFENGTSGQVGLEQLYREAKTIRDLNANPPQRIALMRLLLCITQAALDGPENEEEWKTCRDRIIPSSLEYLSSRHDRFNLYGEKPFLQVKTLSSKKFSTLDKLMETSIGENPMFLGCRAQDGRLVTHAEKVLAMLVFLNFSAGGRIGQAVWSGTQYSDPTFASPCFNRLFLFIHGSDLLETLRMNLILGHHTGQPTWDRMPTGPGDKGAFMNAHESDLGRMVPLTRMLLLPERDGVADCVIGPVPKEYVFSNEPDEGFREPYCTLRLSKDSRHYYMPVDVRKHIWRELGSVLALKTTTEEFSALNLPNIIHAGVKIIDIWCGGLAKGATAAKIYDMAEWNFSIPANLLEENELSKYINGVDLASSAEYSLKKASQEYAKILNEQTNGFSRNATAQYWSALDASYQLLVDIASDHQQDLTGWRAVLRKAMFEAFDAACPHDTPRQIQAYAQARKLLYIKEKKDVSAA